MQTTQVSYFHMEHKIDHCRVAQLGEDMPLAYFEHSVLELIQDLYQHIHTLIDHCCLGVLP